MSEQTLVTAAVLAFVAALVIVALVLLAPVVGSLHVTALAGLARP